MITSYIIVSLKWDEDFLPSPWLTGFLTLQLSCSCYVMLDVVFTPWIFHRLRWCVIARRCHLASLIFIPPGCRGNVHVMVIISIKQWPAEGWKLMWARRVHSNTTRRHFTHTRTSVLISSGAISSVSPFESPFYFSFCRNNKCVNII